MVGDWGVNDKETPGIPHSFSEVLGVALSCISQTDLVSGIGGLDAVKGASFDQAVIEAYLWNNVRAFMRNFSINEETIALNVVKEVGHGNTFLMHPHTAKNFKKELFFRDENRLAWEMTYSDNMVPEAKDIARKLLKDHTVPSLDKSILQKGDQIISDYEKISS